MTVNDYYELLVNYIAVGAVLGILISGIRSLL